MIAPALDNEILNRIIAIENYRSHFAGARIPASLSDAAREYIF